MRALLIPKGKTITLRTGNYVFTGPLRIPESDKFRFPATYDDGTPLKWVEVDDTAKKPDNPVFVAPPNFDSSEGGSGNSTIGEDSSGLSGVDPVRKRKRKVDGVEGIHGERQYPDDAR